MHYLINQITSRQCVWLANKHLSVVSPQLFNLLDVVLNHIANLLASLTYKNKTKQKTKANNESITSAFKARTIHVT